MRNTAGAETRPPDRNSELHLGGRGSAPICNGARTGSSLPNQDMNPRMGGRESLPAAKMLQVLNENAMRNAAGAEPRL